MHIDMHYYGTYALARLAGIAEKPALTVATAAQFVDDSNESKQIMIGESIFQSEVTTHHNDQKEELNDLVSQTSIWVPFHFLPGGEGKGITQKLVCRKDSAIANKMVERYIQKAPGELFGLHLMGVCAHVYADTFAHYGFSGVASRRNAVDSKSFKLLNAEGYPLVRSKFGEFFMQYPIIRNNVRAIVSSVAEEVTDDGRDGGALGHAGVAFYPDEPYLHWQFRYEFPDMILDGGEAEHNNPEDFIEGCEKLHGMFVRFRDAWKEDISDKSTYRPFAEVADQIRSILAFEDGKKARSANWQKRAKEFWDIKIPNYPGGSWKAAFTNDAAMDIPESDVHKFFRAAAYHKYFVVRELLPENGIHLV